MDLHHGSGSIPPARRHGEAKGASDESQKANPHVPDFLSGKKRMPRQIPGHYQLGSSDQAVIYVDLFAKCWKNTPGAIAWLERNQ